MRLLIVPMDLLILRHGKAGERGGDVPDEERSLTKKGIRDIRRVSRWMTRSGTVPDLIVSSPLPRAKETAEIVADRIAFPGEIALWDELMPGPDPALVSERLGELEGASLPLLVGHEPQLSSLAALLIGAGADARIVLEKGGIAKIGNLSPGIGGTGDLQWLLTLRQVRDMV
jgi:phosphohistidine phosphatase